MLERPKMLWFGRPPSEHDLREAKNRGLAIEEVPPGTIPDYTYARAIVFWATTSFFEATAEALEASIPAAINHGLYLHIVVGSEGQRKDIARVLETGLPNEQAAGHYRLRVEPVEPHEGPNDALTHIPGPPANAGLEVITPSDCALNADQLLLLQRAFHDCRSIALQRISGGRSGALTLLVDATLRDSNAGPHPMPYFAKLGPSDKLRQEMRRFQEFAEHHIEWHLRPNFVAERRIYGVHEGILVGPFVRASCSLWEAVVAGGGPSYIRSLFEDTLGILRQETEQEHPDAFGSVVEPLEQFCKFDNVPLARIDAARALGGQVHTPRSLWRKLLDLPKRRWRRSSIHGDMHGENVRVRKEDAILIDFAQACTGPMSADLASLEVWLAFAVDDGAGLSREQWQQRIEALYAPEAIDPALAGLPLPGRIDAVVSCLQEIRRLAQASVHCPEEYRRVIAVYLLRHATFPPDEDRREEDEFRRTYAYWLANRLVVALCAAHEPQMETA